MNFSGLELGTLYAYRVGDGRSWSEWFQFCTAGDKLKPFSFIYVGDVQNAILSQWSRIFKAAVLDAPKARFFLHTGDLVNHGNFDPQCGEWFEAAGWVYAMIPSQPAIGNHEYYKYGEDGTELSPSWRSQFALPQNGIAELHETVDFIDFQDCRFVVLNSCEKMAEQTVWLEKVLSDHARRWTFITFHHTVNSSARGRDNQELRELWQPLFNRYQVDQVFQGHDHTYARGRNLPAGVNKKDDPSGPVYVVSVSGPKMYELTDNKWMDVAAENMQLYQVITVSADTLRHRAKTVTGQLYDAFDFIKNENGLNTLIDRRPEERIEWRFGELE